MKSILLVRDGIVSNEKFESFFRPYLNLDQRTAVNVTNPRVRRIAYWINSMDELYHQHYNVAVTFKDYRNSYALEGEWEMFVMTRGVTDQHMVRLRWSAEQTLLLLVLPLFAQFRRKKRLTWQERKRKKDLTLPIKKRKREDKPLSGWRGITAEKESRHRSIDGGIVHGGIPSDRCGYKFCPGSIGVQDHCYRKFCHCLVCDFPIADGISNEASLMTLRDFLLLTLASEVTVNAYVGFWEDKSRNPGKSRLIVSAAAGGDIGDAVLDYLLRLMNSVIVHDYVFQRLTDRVNRVLEFTAYAKKPAFGGITIVLALSIAPFGSDSHRYDCIFHQQVLLSQRGLETCGLSVSITPDSKQLIKERPFTVNIDQLLRSICQKSSINLSAGKLKALPLHATFVDLMVVDSKGLRKLDDYDSILGATESGQVLNFGQKAEVE